MLKYLSWIETEAVCEPADTYHAREELSCSKFKDFLDSPEWFYLRHIAKTESGECSSSSMDFGTAIHEDLLLEAFIKGYKIIPPKVLAKNGAKSGNAWKEFRASNPGILLKLEEAKALDAVTQAVLQHPLAMDLLSQAEGDVSELTLLSTVQLPDSDHTWRIKSRLDKLKACGFVVDLKTIADMGMMKKRPYEHRWGLQAYLYREAAKCYLERDIDVRFVVVETKAPRRVRVWAPSQETLFCAEELAFKALLDIAGRMLLNDWNAKDWLKVQEF